MGYKRRQKDLERKNKKRNPYAKSLSNAQYRQRIVENKKIKQSKSRQNLNIKINDEES